VGDARLGALLAFGGDLEGNEARLILASTSPQRRAILEQLRLPFDVVAPDYDELGDDPVEHAVGKARSIDGHGRVVLGVDTDVFLDERRLGKAADEAGAAEMLERLSGRTHEVVSGLCVRTDDWEELGREVTRVSFRPLADLEIDRYVTSGEWEERAGAYAIQGLGASLVERIEGDYLNVVGLPAALLVRILAERFPGAYGFG
jgi:septum formation protein